MIKVIAGKYKNRNLLTPPSEKTLPTKSRVREAIFSAIKNEVKDSIVLDLFAGSGAFSIEALSRGSKFCYLNDIDKECASIIKRNFINLNENNYLLLNYDYKKALEYIKEKDIKLDIIFLDPPYRLDIYKECINFILNNNLLNKKGLFILETNSQLQLNDIENKFSDIRFYSYGYSKIYILRT